MQKARIRTICNILKEVIRLRYFNCVKLALRGQDLHGVAGCAATLILVWMYEPIQCHMHEQWDVKDNQMLKHVEILYSLH